MQVVVYYIHVPFIVAFSVVQDNKVYMHLGLQHLLLFVSLVFLCVSHPVLVIY